MPATLSPDLWPSDLLSEPAAPTPIAILRQQGQALGARTHNFVHGEVETEPTPEGTAFTHFMLLLAPFLRYRKRLLLVHHGLQPFPATVYEGELTRQQDSEQWRHTVNNEKELQDRLREFFNREQVKTVVRSLINLSNDVAPSDDE